MGVGAGVRSVIVLSILAAPLAACRVEPNVVKTSEQCAALTGQYVSTATIVATDGSGCNKAKQRTVDRLNFDSQGALISPADPIIVCTTRQDNCNLNIACDALGIIAVFDGQIGEDAATVIGQATVKHMYEGCRSIVYDVEVVRRTP
jgi:hypothetical protein